MKRKLLVLFVQLFWAAGLFSQVNTRISAESFESVSQGIQKSADTGNEGGTCIGWITNGSYAYYGNFDFGSGTTSVKIRVASQEAGGTIQIRLGSPGGTLAGQVSVPGTGGWSNYITRETTLSRISGRQTLYLVFTGGDGYLFNVAWFEFSGSASSSGTTSIPVSTNSAVSGSFRIEAEKFTNASQGIAAADIADGQGGVCIGWISNGSYISLGTIDFGMGVSMFRARVASQAEGGIIEVRLGSPSGALAGKLNVTGTGDWNRFDIKETSLAQISGRQDLFLVFRGGDGYLLNVDWVEFPGLNSAQTATQPKTTMPSPASNTSSATLSPVDGSLVFSNWNKAFVYNGVSSGTYFYLPQRTTITRVITYHWNNGRGATAGQISIKSQNGTVAGTWQSIGTSGTGGAQNVNWIVMPNVTLEPGTYQIIDSDMSTWSQNNESFGAGFTMVYGK